MTTKNNNGYQIQYKQGQKNKKMEKHNLELKIEVKNANQNVVIYASKQRGGRLVFPIDTPVEDYLRFKQLGFNIFRCSFCKSDGCIGNCNPETINKAVQEKYTSKEEKEARAQVERYADNSSIDELAKDLDMFDNKTDEELEEIINGTAANINIHGDEVVDVDYEKYSLKELREMFPNIKDTSKKGFITKIK